MENKNVEIIDELLRDIIMKYHRMESKARGFKRLKNLTITEIETIYVIGDDRPKTMKEIAADLDVTVSTPTTTIDRLIKKDCVERFHGVKDRRQVLVQLTNKGKRMLEEIKKIKIETTKFLVEVLSDSEIEFMKTILIKLNKNIEC